MSRFSKKAAQEAGWSFFHKSDEEEVVLSSTQGKTKTIPASLKAEKYVNGQLVTEEAPSIRLLLERINAYEQHLKAIGVTSESVDTEEPVVPEVQYDPYVGEGENPLVPTGEFISLVPDGSTADAQALLESEKSSDPQVDPEGEAGPQVFPLESPESEEDSEEA